MALNVTVGDLRAKTKTAVPNGELYAGDIPILTGGVERGVLHVAIFVDDDMTLAEIVEMLASGLTVRFNG